MKIGLKIVTEFRVLFFEEKRYVYDMFLYYTYIYIIFTFSYKIGKISNYFSSSYDMKEIHLLTSSKTQSISKRSIFLFGFINFVV